MYKPLIAADLEAEPTTDKSTEHGQFPAVSMVSSNPKRVPMGDKSNSSATKRGNHSKKPCTPQDQVYSSQDQLISTPQSVPRHGNHSKKLCAPQDQVYSSQDPSPMSAPRRGNRSKKPCAPQDQVWSSQDPSPLSAPRCGNHSKKLCAPQDQVYSSQDSTPVSAPRYGNRSKKPCAPQDQVYSSQDPSPVSAPRRGNRSKKPCAPQDQDWSSQDPSPLSASRRGNRSKKPHAPQDQVYSSQDSSPVSAPRRGNRSKKPCAPQDQVYSSQDSSPVSAPRRGNRSKKPCAPQDQVYSSQDQLISTPQSTPRRGNRSKKPHAPQDQVWSSQDPSPLSAPRLGNCSKKLCNPQDHKSFAKISKNCFPESSNEHVTVTPKVPSDKITTVTTPSTNLQEALHYETSGVDAESQAKLALLLKDLKQKQVYCEENSMSEISQLEGELSAFPKMVPLDKFDQQKAKKRLIRRSIEESTLRKEVFLKCCAEIQYKLESNEGPSFDSLCASFYREVQRYDKALPIYAHRLNFMKTVKAHQVCILIGETGSGKSTQLVQYLSEAEYASNGLIVCTQPRKLAAISLAEHVSREVDEKVGETYGYVAARSKRSAKTEVLYMTDHTLLNECIEDPYLHKYSCLVIDEAHERSIHTDILIAFIKRCLPYREDLKVIITSATIDPTLFSIYFNHCPIIEVPGRTYPVQVNWDLPEVSILERDYVSEAVSKVRDIHISKWNEPGDVLVFLTCPAEIERACKLAKETLKNNATVLPLHGKLQPEDQQKIFECTERGKRKVVFSTNVAETSVTIPGIVYVIDTGLSKELCYDPQKNMNSLEIRPISKSSADQRKGRAGRTCPGKCYRLYSEMDYANMRNNSTPEILRITLAFAVIKLYEFGIQDIHSFEFVESPDRKALDEAIENLNFLGAIKDGKLTKLGEKMAFLPLEPNLSKVLLDAIDKGIGMEAAAAVAVSTLAGRVFFRPVATESQEESDKKKLTFCQQSGDQMTYLHTYFEWSLRSRKHQTQWCMENYVNAKSMRMIQQVVEELLFILKQKLHSSKIPDKITSLDEADKILPKLFFDSFLRNICIHLGHNRVGYWSEKLPTEQLVIHYGSSLHHLNSVPQYVVYETTQKTSQHFLLQALPVREEWIQEAVRMGKLPCHPLDNSLFQFYQVSPLCFSNLGPRMVMKLSQKYPQNRSIPVSEFAEFEVQPVFELLRNQGTLKVFSQDSYHDCVCASVSNQIESVKQYLKEETHRCGILSENDDVKIIIGVGGCIQRILMPGDFQTIVVRGLCNRYIPDAQYELESYGKCTSDITSNQKGKLLFVKFSNPTDAAKALRHRFVAFSDPEVKIMNCREQNRNQFCLKIEWWRRKRRDYGFVNFKIDQGEFHTLFYPLFRNRVEIIDQESGLHFDPTWDRCSIRICGVKNYMSEKYISSRLSYHGLLLCEYDIFFLYSDAFEETEESLLEHRDRLDAKLAQHASKSKYYVEFATPTLKSTMYRAFVNFDDSALCSKMFRCFRREFKGAASNDDVDLSSNSESDDGDIIYDEYEEGELVGDSDDEYEDGELVGDSDDEYEDGELVGDSDDDDDDGDSIEGQPDYLVEMKLTSSTRYTKKVFSVIKPSIKCIRQCFVTSQLVTIDYDRKDHWENTFVNITASDIDAFTEAKEALAKAVEPDIVHFTDCKQSQYASTTNFRKTITEIQTHTSTYIKINASSLSTSSIVIYGTQEQRDIAKQEVDLHFQENLSNGVECFEVNLKEHGPGLMKHLIREHGNDVSRLSDVIKGIVATRLNPRRQILTLFATEAGHQSFLQSLDSFKPKNVTPQVQPPDVSTDISECCVCFESHSSKRRKTFFYRLELCGHVYCKECIQQQLESTSIEFPVTCAADQCDEQLVWRDFDNLFKDKVKMLRDITSASLKSYIARNSDIVHNCITPDCEMIYTVSNDGKRFICRKCSANICTKCHTTWHEGFDTCGAFKNRSSGDKEFRKWMSGNKKNRKNCPKCQVPIEKSAGCQHVCCAQCKAHICWNCLKYFETSPSCYQHLHAKHGGYL